MSHTDSEQVIGTCPRLTVSRLYSNISQTDSEQGIGTYPRLTVSRVQEHVPD